MEFATTPLNIVNAQELLKNGLDIIIAGNDAFSLRQAHTYSLNELKTLRKLTNDYHKKLFIALQSFIHEFEIEELSIYLDFLKNLDVDGILFSDLAVYQLAKEKGLLKKLYYHPETLNTNQYDSKFWSQQHISGLVLARETTLQSLLESASVSNIKTLYYGHGYLAMFHSRRNLISSYLSFIGEKNEALLNNQHLFLEEEKRQETYPIFQDKHGTHILRTKPMESFAEIKRIGAEIDIFVIESLLMKESDILEVLKDYQLALQMKDDQVIHSIEQKYIHSHDKGFLYKETIYKKRRDVS
jgi:putative protease